MKIEPRQKRSILAKKKLKDTARKLFTDKGYYGITSNMIANEAKVPIGSFYNYYDNKKDVLLELIRESNNEFHKETSIDEYIAMDFELKTPEDVSQLIQRALVSTLFSNYLSDPFYKIIHTLQFTDKDVLALSDEIRTKEINGITNLLNTISEFHSLDNIPLKAKLIHSTMENVGVYIHLLGSNVNNEELIEETVKMIYSYVFAT